MDGINVDFENLKEAGIPHYLQFLRELTSAAHAQNLVVSVDTPVPQAYTMYYQRGEQARFVDYMIVMAYDEHFAGSEEAGSVSSLPFVQQAVEEMTRVMPADQVICGIPFYTVSGRKSSDRAPLPARCWAWMAPKTMPKRIR